MRQASSNAVQQTLSKQRCKLPMMNYRPEYCFKQSNSRNHNFFFVIQELKSDQLRKGLPFGTIEEVEKRHSEITTCLETSCLDLKTEKDLLKELQTLSSSKGAIVEWDAQLEKVKRLREAYTEILKLRQTKVDELSALREEERKLIAKIESVKDGERSDEHSQVNSLITTILDEKAALVTTLKNKKAALQECIVNYKISVAEHREYKQALAAYDKKLEKLEYQRRKADAAAKADRVREERKQWESERREERRRQEQRMLAVAQGCQIFVGGLALRCDEDALLAYFSRFGPVSDHSVVRDPETKLSRGFGFVTFPNAQNAAAAVGASHGVEVRDLSAAHGRLSVRLAEKSKAQLEFEARRAAARAETGPADGDKCEKAQLSDGGGGKGTTDGMLERETCHDEVVEAAEGATAGAADDSGVAQPVMRAQAEARGQPDASRAGDARPPPPPPPALPANAGVRQWPAPPAAVPMPPASAGASTAPSERRAAAAGGTKLGRGDANGGACSRNSGDKPPRPAREVLPAGAEAA
uniref:RRM domain-containing protein n=1 Tax=Cryptomonas curvata TaxID=233186 RepID=A0A7S0N6J2_9CRYP|mmetsp:Transcript_8163/g.17501  ORF Transcript_8163/g.17501 Transcript_8163/m.17501 type:complete len:527 (+) Transcript_8163:431-2011(+)